VSPVRFAKGHRAEAQLNFGRRDDPVLQIMRRVLREARIVAKSGGDAHPVVLRRVIPLPGRR